MGTPNALILSRNLALIAYIDRHPGITVKELATHFGRTSTQIKRDIQVLDEAGFGDFLPDKTFELDMDRYLKHGQLAIFSSLQVKSPPRLTADEAAALILGIEAIAPTLTEEESASVPGLIASVLSLAGGAGADAVSLVKVIESNFPARTWQQIRRAIAKNRRVSLHYVSSDSRHSRRQIDPLTLVRTDEGWLVRAWCHQVEAIRNFRVDRILSYEILDVPQKHPHAEELDEGNVCHVTLRPQAGWRAGELPAIRVEHNGTRAVASFQVWSPSWMTSRLLGLASDVESTEPESYLVAAGQQAREAIVVWDDFL